MNDLSFPNIWLSRKALDCFIQISTNNRNVKTKDCKSEGLYPVIDQGQQFICGYIDDESKVIQVSNPLCVFGDHTRIIKWVTQDFVPGADGTKILEAEEFIFPKYGYYALRFIDIPDKGYSRHFKYLRELEIPISSLAEQKIIADKLDDLLARVESIKTRLENIPGILKKFRQSVLVSAFQGHLTKEWRSKNFELKRISLNDIKEYWSDFYKKTGTKKAKLNLHVSDDIGNLPDTWLDTKIGFVFDVHVGATPSRNIKEYWNGDIPWVSSSEVAFSRIIKTKEKITVLGLDKASTSIHPVGTVMLAMIGQGKTRGQAAILDIEACHNQNTAALRVPSGFAISEFLYLFLEKQYEETRRVGGGNNQQALNKSFVQSLGFPLPPIEEQIEIIENLNKLFHHTDIIQKQTDNALSKINNLTQSILAKAFRGELTAQWREENPELISGLNSAEALLEKITAEKLAAGTVKKRAKKTSH